jgi:hypothetical protein
MLAWHKNMADDQVFTSLLPNDQPWKTLGKIIFEALRNGLAHRFRPDTLKIGNEAWRFRIYWHDGTPIDAVRGNPNWVVLSAKSLEQRVIERIDAYEKELRHDPYARVTFAEKSQKSIRRVPAQARNVVSEWNMLIDR